MTDNFSYKRHRKKFTLKRGFAIFFIFCVIVLAVLIVVNVADIISSLISNDTSIFSTGKIRISNTTMYALSVGQYSNQQDAEKMSTSVSSQGAAGYIYHSGDYFVFTSLYDSIIDAKSVVEKLKQDKVEANIVNINIPAINLSYKGKNGQKIIDCIDFFKSCYQGLYDISLRYDSGEITTNQAKDAIATLLSQSKQVLKTIADIIEQESKPHLVLLESKLMSVNLILQNLYDFQPQGLNFNSAIKYSYFKVVICNIDYAKQI